MVFLLLTLFWFQVNVNAQFGFNTISKTYYCKNPAYNVNQEEYNDLACEYLKKVYSGLSLGYPPLTIEIDILLIARKQNSKTAQHVANDIIILLREACGK